MPYDVFKEGSRFCVHKHDADHKPMGKAFGCHESEEDARAQMRALYASDKKALANTVRNILEAKVHGSFSEAADALFSMGYLNRDQRIALSGGIGEALNAMAGVVDESVWNLTVMGDDVEFLCKHLTGDYYMMDEPGGMAYMDSKAIDKNVGGGVDRDKLKDSDFVFSDTRTFPIVNASDVKDAVSSWGRYKGKHSFEEFKRRLIALAKRKNLEGALPKEWGKDKKAIPDLIATSMKGLYDAQKADHVWMGVSHNAWIDDVNDIIPLKLIQADIDWQTEMIRKGKLSQCGDGLWLDHDAKTVLGDCLVREVIEGGRSCFEAGNLFKAEDAKYNGSQMSIGFHCLKDAKGEYVDFIKFESSVLKKMRRVNGITFFSVKRRAILDDAAISSMADEFSSALGG